MPALLLNNTVEQGKIVGKPEEPCVPAGEAGA